MQYILRYVNLILQLSREPLSHIDVKPIDEEKVWLFTDYLSAALEQETVNRARTIPELGEAYAAAAELLCSLGRKIPVHKQLSRSSWLTELEGEGTAMAEAMINLCYNYTVEESILGVTKRYGSNKEDFVPDFLNRLAARPRPVSCGDWEEPEIRREELPDWSLAVSTMDEAVKLKTLKPRKRENPEALWRRLSRWGLGKKLLSTLVYVPLFFVMEWGMDLLETALTDPAQLRWPALAELPSMALSALVTTFAFGMLSGLLSKWITVPDISETVEQLVSGVRDLWALCREQNGGKRHDA